MPAFASVLVVVEAVDVREHGERAAGALELGVLGAAPRGRRRRSDRPASCSRRGRSTPVRAASAQAPASKECATSGALPPRIAATILSSEIPPTTFTWMSGCVFSKSAITSFMTPSSRSVKPFRRSDPQSPTKTRSTTQPAITLAESTKSTSPAIATQLSATSSSGDGVREPYEKRLSHASSPPSTEQRLGCALESLTR